MSPRNNADRIIHVLDPYGASATSARCQVGPWTLLANSLDSDRAPIAEVDGLAIASWARLDNRADVATDLGADPSIDDNQLILKAFEHWGAECVQHLVGDFSFVIVNAASGEAFAARDAIGVRPFYYAVNPTPLGTRLIVSTTAAVFPEFGDVALTPSERWMARFVSRSSMSHTATAWEEVHKLAGGHTLTWSPGEQAVNIERYHEWRNDPPKAKRRSSTELDAYRTVLHEAVRCRSGGTEPIGVETSGGIDSSTCLALTAKLGQRSVGDIHAFGYVALEKEPAHILQTSEMYGIENNHIFGDVFEERNQNPDIIDRTIAVLGYPSEHSSGPGHDQFYERCEQLGIHSLQSGFGGDEVVTNPGGPLFRELIDERRFVELYRCMAGTWYAKFARLAKTVWQQRASSRGAGRLRTSLEPMVALYGVRPDVDERAGVTELQLDRLRYDEGFRDLNEWILSERLGNDFVPTRLENCSLMARSRGIDYSWPLLDQRLIQRYLSTPSIEKRGPGIGRYLHRRAIDGDVPDDVAWKVSKEMGAALGGGPRAFPRGRVDDVLGNLHPTVEALIDVDKVRRVAAMTTPNAERVTRTQIMQIEMLNHWLHRHHPADDA